MKVKQNIAFYCSSLSWGGLEMNTLKRALWMQERGHTVELFCVHQSPLYVEAVNTGVSVVTVKRNRKSIDLSNAIRVKRAFSKKGIELIWFADKRDLSVLATVKKLSGKRFKLLFQQSMQMGVSKREWWHTVRFNQIDFWIAPLHYLANQVEEKTRFPKERVYVIPQGLDIEAFVERLPEKEKARSYFGLSKEDLVVGMIGRIDPAKAQAFVMETITELQKEFHQLKLLFVGSKTEGEWENYYNDLKKKIDREHADKSVVLFPFMKEVGMFYSAVDIFVMASKNETYGMVTIESMLAGKMIVGTKSAGTQELLADGERGYHFEWMNKESLKKALYQLLGDLDEAKCKAKLGQDYALKTFDYHQELDEIEALICAEQS